MVYTGAHRNGLMTSLLFQSSCLIYLPRSSLPTCYSKFRKLGLLPLFTLSSLLLHLDRLPRLPLSQQGEYTALMWASFRGDVQVVRSLLDHGAEIDLRNKVCKM